MNKQKNYIYRSQVLDELHDSNKAWLAISKNTDKQKMIDDLRKFSSTGILTINVWFLEDQDTKTYFINGTGFRYLRRKYAHQKAEHLDDKEVPLIPLSYEQETGEYIEPIHMRFKNKPPIPDVGYIYSQEHDLDRLWAFVQAVNDINNRYTEFKIKDSPGKELKNYGIIGYDFPFTEPEWLKSYAVGDAKYNPYFTKDGVYYFGAASIDMIEVKRVIKKLKKVDPEIWKNLSTPIDMYTKTAYQKIRQLAKENEFVVFNTVWSGHAITIMTDPLDSKYLWVIDPWKTPNIISKDENFQKIQEQHKKLVFVPQLKLADQESEGSCVIVSFARTLWIAREGPSVALDHPIPYEYAILAYRLLRPKNRIVLKVNKCESSDDDSDVEKQRKLKEKQLVNYSAIKTTLHLSTL